MLLGVGFEIEVRALGFPLLSRSFPAPPGDARSTAHIKSVRRDYPTFLLFAVIYASVPFKWRGLSYHMPGRSPSRVECQI